MIDAGMKDANPGAGALVPVDMPREARGEFAGRPVAMPGLPAGHRLFAGYDQGFGEKLILVETLEDAQHVWDRYAVGGAIFPPSWYSAPALFTQDN